MRYPLINRAEKDLFMSINCLSDIKNSSGNGDNRDYSPYLEQFQFLIDSGILTKEEAEIYFFLHRQISIMRQNGKANYRYKSYLRRIHEIDNKIESKLDKLLLL